MKKMLSGCFGRDLLLVAGVGCGSVPWLAEVVAMPCSVLALGPSPGAQDGACSAMAAAPPWDDSSFLPHLPGGRTLNVRLSL